MEKEQVMNWKPMGDQVLLKVEKKSEKTKSGIISRRQRHGICIRKSSKDRRWVIYSNRSSYPNDC